MRWQAPELLVSGRFRTSIGSLSADPDSIIASSVSPKTDVYAFASVCLEVLPLIFRL